MQYDAANHLTSRVSTNDGPVAFDYDPVGNRTEAVDATGRSTFTYELLNRRTGVVDPAGHAITCSYDVNRDSQLTDKAECRAASGQRRRGQIVGQSKARPAGRRACNPDDDFRVSIRLA